MALLSVFATMRAACCGMNCNSVSASSAGRPRTSFSTRRAFCGLIPVYFGNCSNFHRTRSPISKTEEKSKTGKWRQSYCLRVLRSDLTWPRKKRVGANSPSLWPTMFSVM